ncbi:Branched-chain-amino-acid aminotransferase [Balamuthia mandrillaris]
MRRSAVGNLQLAGGSLGKGPWVSLARTNSMASSQRMFSTASVDDLKPRLPRDSVKGELSFKFTRTDFMYVAETGRDQPWKEGKLLPYGPLSLEPAATVLSYGQGIFEGIKAFRTVKGRVVVFRPQENAKRFGEGAQRFMMPPVPEKVFMHAIDSIVKGNSDYIPEATKGSLYLRPLLFGSGGDLGVGPSSAYTFTIYASPVGNYFKDGPKKGIELLASTDVHRAAPKGSGWVKCIGNYAPCFAPQQKAKKEGFAEVLYLDAKHEKYVEEAGAANVFCVTADGTLYTPSLEGSILPGVTRKSIIQLARDRGYKVEEKRLPIEVMCNAAEAFCSGTGASITPIGGITYQGKRHAIGDGTIGKITKELYEALLDVQLERAEDKHGWLHDPYAAATSR